MVNTNRLNRSKSNIIWMIVYQIVSIIVNILVRKIFLNHIDVYYLGIDNIVNSIIGIVQICEIGIGSSACYYLIKAFASEEEQELKAIYKSFIDINKIILIIFVAINLLLSLFLGSIISFKANEYSFVLLIFLMNVLDKFLYLIYVRDTSVIIYNQQQDYIHKTSLVVITVFFILKVILIPKFPNLIFFVLIRIIQSTVTTILCKIKASQIIPLKNVDNELVKVKKKEIVDYALKNLVVIIVTIIFTYKDNIIITNILGIDGTNDVGIMSNYTNIVVAITSLSIGVFNSISASVSNFINDSNVNDEQNLAILLQRLNFLCFLIGSFCTVYLFGLTNDFISLVYGTKYVLHNYFLLTITLNLTSTIFFQPYGIFITAKGKVYHQTFYSIVMLIVSIILGILLTKILGITGVILSTLIANTIKLLGDILILNKMFKISMISTYKKLLVYLLIIFVQVLVINFVFNNMASNIFEFVFKGFILTIIFGLGLILFIKKDEFRYFIERFLIK